MPMPATKRENNTQTPRVGTDTAIAGAAHPLLMDSLSSISCL